MIVVKRGYKFCADCRECLPKQRFYKRRSRRGRSEPDAYCKACRQVRTREHYRWIRSDPERRAAHNAQIAAAARRRRAADPEYAERERERHRKWLAGLSAAERERLAQDARIRSALARERKVGKLPDGRRRNPAVPGAFNEERQTTRLEPGPLLEVLPPDWQGQTQAQKRRLYDLRQGVSQHVSLAVADELLGALGRSHLLPTLYG